jgi:hypothetical protein
MMGKLGRLLKTKPTIESCAIWKRRKREPLQIEICLANRGSYTPVAEQVCTWTMVRVPRSDHPFLHLGTV